MGWLRSVSMRALMAVLWWPWLVPTLAVLLLAGAGGLGADWLVWTGLGVALLGLAVLLGLGYLGRRARQPVKPPACRPPSGLEAEVVAEFGRDRVRVGLEELNE
ncbi:hypothetical protein [Kibdelosporangium aridum]|uniref:hypothetical protein n=1 Tax=Kibdelosporangium aridum TaxID=2030 RepID=UPI000F79AE6B|nr:hypothetical protein [Kibdelosporangium aridum]